MHESISIIIQRFYILNTILYNSIAILACTYLVCETVYHLAIHHTCIQQPQTNVVVVKQQPTPVVSRTTYSDPSIGSGPLIFSIFVTVFAVCCCWWALLCSIPAIIFAVNVRYIFLCWNFIFVSCEISNSKDYNIRSTCTIVIYICMVKGHINYYSMHG